MGFPLIDCGECSGFCYIGSNSINPVWATAINLSWNGITFLGFLFLVFYIYQQFRIWRS